jgi:hypothetical protein
MATKNTKKAPALSFRAFALAAALAIGSTPALAQKHGGGGHGGGGGGHGGASSDRADQIDSGHSASSHSEGKGGKGGKGGSQGMGMRRGGGHAQSLRDIFREMESEPTKALTTTSSSESGHGNSGKGGGRSSKASSSSTTTHGSSRKGGGHSGKVSTSATTTHGKKGAATAGRKDQTTPSASETEDSDRPAYAGVPGKEGKPGRGNTETGVKKGDLYGDMYVILRDANGVPIYLTLADGAKVVQPVGADGQPLPLDAEGNLIDPTLAIAVELGRLNVGRSPLHVLSAQYEDAISSINAADSVSLDASGRIVLTTNGVSAAIDSPLQNLALYTELLNEGYITGLTDAAKAKFEASNLGYLVDGSATLTQSKLLSAADLFAAAADKTSTLNVDKIQDMNAILGISGTLTVDGKLVTDPNTGGTFVDYSSLTYDRKTTYDGKTANVLVLQPGTTDTYKVTTVNLYDAVFGGKDAEATSAAAFTQAADDSLQVLEYLHDHPIPVP